MYLKLLPVMETLFPQRLAHHLLAIPTEISRLVCQVEQIGKKTKKQKKTRCRDDIPAVFTKKKKTYNCNTYATTKLNYFLVCNPSSNANVRLLYDSKWRLKKDRKKSSFISLKE